MKKNFITEFISGAVVFTMAGTVAAKKICHKGDCISDNEFTIAF